MATTPNGIMTLPENDQMGAPQLSLNESYDAMRQGLKNARPDAAADVDSTMAEILPQLDGMPDDVIDKLLQTVQYLKDNPDQYVEVVAKLISMGVVKEGDFPPEYDPEFLATMGIVLLEAQRSRSQAPLQPTGFASGGLADAARIMAAQGRGRDSMLAHITPSEASLLRSRGGMGTRNPSTGLPEYGFFDDLWSGVKGAVTGVFDAVKGVLKSPIGRVVGTIALGAFLGPGAFGITGLGLGAAAAPLASGIISGFSGGSAMDMLTSAATSYLGSSASPLSQYVGNLTSGLGLGSMASQALTSGLVGTGVGLLTGKSLEDSVSSGLQGAAMNAAMDYMNTNKAPVSAADRAPVSDAVIKPVPGLNDEIGSNLKQAGVSAPRINNPSAYVNPGASPTPLPSVAPAPVAQTTSAPVAQAASATTGDYKYPDLMDSAGKMFQPGRFMEGAKDTFFPSGPTSKQVTDSAEYANLVNKGFTGKEAFERVSNDISPGMLRQYGPLAAAGLGIMGLTGGFEQKPIPQSRLNASLTGGEGSYQDLMAKNPRKYYAQNLPGVLYDNNGAIIGYKGPGGSPQLYAAQGGAVGYAEGGEAWDGPAWGPGSMVYPSIAAAIAAGVPRNKLFKTALEAYYGKANVADTVTGGGGNDSIVGGGGNDSVVGGTGNDSITGGADGVNNSGDQRGPGTDNTGGITGLNIDPLALAMARVANIFGSSVSLKDPAPVTDATFNSTQAGRDYAGASGKSSWGKSGNEAQDIGTAPIGPAPTGGFPTGTVDLNAGELGIASSGVVSDRNQTQKDIDTVIGFQDAERDRENAAIVAASDKNTTPISAPSAIGGNVPQSAAAVAANTGQARSDGYDPGYSGGYDGGGDPGADGAGPQAKGGYIGGYAQGGIMGLDKVRRLYDGGDAAGYGYGEGEGAAQGAGVGGYGSMGELDGGGASRISQSNIANQSNRKSSLPAYDSVMLAQSLEPMRPAMVGHTSGIITGIQDANNNVSRNFYGYQDVQQAKDAYESLVAEQGMRNNIDNNTFSFSPNDRAKGGMMGSNGIASLLKGGYPRKIGEIAGPGTGTSDDIPAMLSDGEFVMTAKAVRGAGKGSRRDGAKRMYALMHQLERNAARG